MTRPGMTRADFGASRAKRCYCPLCVKVIPSPSGTRKPLTIGKAWSAMYGESQQGFWMRYKLFHAEGAK